MRETSIAKRAALLGVAVVFVPLVVLGQSQLGEPVVTPGLRFGVQVTPAFPGGELGEATDTGIGGRLRFANEYMFGRLGVAPGVSFQFLNFSLDFPAGFDEPSGSIQYFGVLPGVQVAGHLGMAAPFFGFGMGFDHFRSTGDFSDLQNAQGIDTSASGPGFEFAMGTDVWFSRGFGGHFGIQIHPGATEWENGDMKFTAFDLGFTAAF